jgi:nitroimidazol reductase NimA-like FMN-containing flavoprotein (pyridoxamine 5'-phosphate oxidase superfamily)
MFNEMRRNDREIDKEQSLKVLEQGQFGILSTRGENGYAYGVPLNYTLHEGSIYFHCATEGSKLDNILSNNKVSFCVVGNTEPIPEKFSYRYESIIVFGRAVEVFENEKEAALIALIQKYSRDFIEKGIEYVKNSISKTKVIKISIEHISGKARK